MIFAVASTTTTKTPTPAPCIIALVKVMFLSPFWTTLLVAATDTMCPALFNTMPDSGV